MGGVAFGGCGRARRGVRGFGCELAGGFGRVFRLDFAAEECRFRAVELYGEVSGGEQVAAWLESAFRLDMMEDIVAPFRGVVERGVGLFWRGGQREGQRGRAIGGEGE